MVEYDESSFAMKVIANGVDLREDLFAGIGSVLMRRDRQCDEYLVRVIIKGFMPSTEMFASEQRAEAAYLEIRDLLQRAAALHALRLPWDDVINLHLRRDTWNKN